jgi:uncharacterized membrane protein
VGIAATEPGLSLTEDREAKLDVKRSAASDVVTRRFVYATTAVYALVFSAGASVTYLAYDEPRFDLGNMVQAIWSTSHGHVLRTTTEHGVEISRLGAHVDPFLVLLVPFWWLWSSPLILLFIQAVSVSAGAIPVYWLARKHLQNSRLAATFAVVYLLYPATQFNVFTPIGLHAVSFSIPLILFAIWFLDERRLVPFAIFGLAAATTKEEIALGVGCLGIWYAARTGRRTVGASIFAIGLAITLFNMLVVIPHYAETGASPFAGRYEAVGATPGGMLHTAVTDPIAFVNAVATWHKFGFVVLLLAPFLGLWLLEPLLLLGALPDLAINLLSSKPEQTTIFYHYTAGIVPFLVAASILGAGRLKRDPRRVMLGVLALVSCLAVISPLISSATNLPFARPSNAVHHATEHALSLIPADARVSATQRLGAYLSARRYIATFPSVGRAEWVIVGGMEPTDDPHVFRRTLARLKTSPSWKLVYRSHGISVLKRRPN